MEQTFEVKFALYEPRYITLVVKSEKSLYEVTNMFRDVVLKDFPNYKWATTRIVEKE
jgi:hypothetical protein